MYSKCVSWEVLREPDSLLQHWCHTSDFSLDAASTSWVFLTHWCGFFPTPFNLLTRPGCGWCTRSWSRGEALELHQRQGLTLTLDQNNGLSCQKALLQTGCAPVCTQVPPVLQAGSDPQPEKQNFKPGTALEFRQLNYLNFFKLLESLWKAGLFYHLSLAGMTSWWLPLSFWKAASIYLNKD